MYSVQRVDLYGDTVLPTLEVIKMISLLCKGVCVDDGYMLLFHDLSLREKKLVPHHDGLDLPSLQFICS